MSQESLREYQSKKQVMLFYTILSIFLLKIAINIYMAFGILLHRLIKSEPYSVSLVLFGAELIIIPVLILGSFISDVNHWWAKPLAVAGLSLALTIFSYLLAVFVVYFKKGAVHRK